MACPAAGVDCNRLATCRVFDRRTRTWLPTGCIVEAELSTRSLLLSFVESVPTGPMADQAHSMLEDEAGAAGPWCHGTSEEPTTGAPS